MFSTTDNGDVYSWGCGYYGVLGHGDEKSEFKPKFVEALKGKRVVSADGGLFHVAIVLGM
jgi:E3 ubiquitin-protein ligase HERC2